MTTPVAVPLWQKVPHTGYYINSVATSANGGVVVAGTFFHTYGGTSSTPAAANASLKQEARVAASRISAAESATSEYGTFGTYVWNRAGNLLMQAEFAGWQGVYWVDASADGSTVASCGWYSGTPSYQGFIAAYDVATGDSLLFYTLPSRGNIVALNADASLLLAGADQGYLFAKASDGSFNGTPSMIGLTASGDTALVTALDSAGATGLIGSYHGEIILFPISNGVAGAAVRWQLPNSAYLHFAALSADGQHAYVGANSGILYAIDVAQFLQNPASIWQAAIPGGATTIYGVACSENGMFIASAGNTPTGGVVAYYASKYNNAAMYWQATTAHSPNSVSMDSAGAWVALADGHPDNTPGCFYLWRSMDGAPLWTFPTSDMSWPIKLSADGSLVVGGSDNGTVYVFAGPTSATT
ncbi:MAG: WD40 repeat domain-containing protein [Pseudomarimonas sp.]